MRVVRHRTAQELLTAAAAFFAETEEKNHLIWAIAESVTRRGGDGAAFFATVEDGGVLAVALQTPPFPIQITALSDAPRLEPRALASRVAQQCGETRLPDGRGSHRLVEALCGAVGSPGAVISDPATAAAVAERLGGGEVRKRLRNHALTT